MKIFIKIEYGHANVDRLDFFSPTKDGTFALRVGGGNANHPIT